jgi:hypothetical protein
VLWWFTVRRCAASGLSCHDRKLAEIPPLLASVVAALAATCCLRPYLLA